MIVSVTENVLKVIKNKVFIKFNLVYCLPSLQFHFNDHGKDYNTFQNSSKS